LINTDDQDIISKSNQLYPVNTSLFKKYIIFDQYDHTTDNLN